MLEQLLSSRPLLLIHRQHLFDELGAVQRPAKQTPSIETEAELGRERCLPLVLNGWARRLSDSDEKHGFQRIVSVGRFAIHQLQHADARRPNVHRKTVRLLLNHLCLCCTE